MSKPNATAGRMDQQDFSTRWRAATEYCAWIYYTPEHKYVISKLTDQSSVDPALRTKKCALPPEVEDARYPADSLKYIYAIHNHPYNNVLSEDDIRFIARAGVQHGFMAETKDGPLRLSTVAFFADGVVDPTCEGFHQYTPGDDRIFTWTRAEGRWECRQTARIVLGRGEFDFSVIKTDAPCPQRNAP